VQGSCECSNEPLGSIKCYEVGLSNNVELHRVSICENRNKHIKIIIAKKFLKCKVKFLSHRCSLC
jgi:hypothetical protein